MRMLTIVLLACVGLSGCVVVPVDPVPYYAAPPAVVVQPSFYYHSDRYYRRH